MKNSRKPQILNSFLRLSVCLMLMWKFVIVGGMAQIGPSERRLENDIPVHVPIKVQVRNLHHEHWARDLEVEIKNTGNKPIYYLKLLLVMPEVKENGEPVAFVLRYGRRELLKFSEHPTPDDIPLAPGESYVLKIPESSSTGWELAKAHRGKSDPQRISLVFQLLNFGDGTGFGRSDGVPIPFKKSSKNYVREERTGGMEMGDFRLRSTVSPSTLLRHTSHPSRVNFLTASLWTKRDVNAKGLASKPDVCCPGSSCVYLVNETGGYNCLCGPADWVHTASCDDPNAMCGTSVTYYDYCSDDYGNEYTCPVFGIIPCRDY